MTLLQITRHGSAASNLSFNTGKCEGFQARNLTKQSATIISLYRGAEGFADARIVERILRRPIGGSFSEFFC